MYSPIWSRLRAVLAVLCLTLAPLATASADPQGIPLQGTLEYTGFIGRWAGTVTGLGLVVANGVGAAQTWFTTQSGEVLRLAPPYAFWIDATGLHIFHDVNGGTGRFQGATGWISTTEPRGLGVLYVDGYLILNP